MILPSFDMQLSLLGWQEMGLSLEDAALLLRWQRALFPCDVLSLTTGFGLCEGLGWAPALLNW